MADDTVKITPAGAKGRKDHDVYEGVAHGSTLCSSSRGTLTNPKGTGLCFTCTSAWITKQTSSNDWRVVCRYEDGVEMPDDIEDCNNYTKVTDLSLFAMTQMATLIDVREPGGHYL